MVECISALAPWAKGKVNVDLAFILWWPTSETTVNTTFADGACTHIDKKLLVVVTLGSVNQHVEQ